jgi:hypothetical protein
MSDFIPDYSKYSVRQLVDVYQRIERDKYPQKVQIIKEHLYSKLSIDSSTDINSYEIQNLFKRILEEDYPFKSPKTKNLDLGKKIDNAAWIFFVVAIVFFLLDKQFNIPNLGLLGILFFIFFVTANVVQSYFTGVIHIKIISIKESEKPTQFAIFQAMFFFMALIGFFAIIRYLTS